MTKYDLMYKGILIGNSGAGKSCLMERFCHDYYRKQHLSTIGIDFSTRVVDIANKKIKVQLWDTSGQERFRSITQSYFRGADFGLVVFDLNDKESFQGTDYWYQTFRKTNPEALLVIVGSKKDLESEVKIQEIRDFAAKVNCIYAETSAKTGEGVEELFQLIVGQLVENSLVSVRPIGAENTDVIKLSSGGTIDTRYCPSCNGSCNGTLKKV